MPTLVNVTGPIAAGASVLQGLLSELMGCEKVLDSTFDIERTNPFLALFGADPSRYAFHNQVTRLYQSAELHASTRRRSSPDKVYLQDYCPYEHTEVYALAQYTAGYLSTWEYEALVRLTRMLEPYFIVPKALIYRALSQEQAIQRITQRARQSEQGLDIRFVEIVRARFDTWVAEWTRSPVIRVSEELDVVRDVDAVVTLTGTIAALLNSGDVAVRQQLSY